MGRVGKEREQELWLARVGLLGGDPDGVMDVVSFSEQLCIWD